jgi:endonuclease VIII
MPEGHTIHRLAADHNRDFSGLTLAVSSPQGRFASGARTLNRRILRSVDAHGKHLLYDWDGKTLHVHLGLYGKFRHHKSPPPEPRGLVRLRVIGEQKAFDLNGPTACELLTKADVQKLLSRLGVDPLRDDADPNKAWDRIRRTISPIGTVLMNQSIIAGVGNVYRSEILHLLNIHPDRLANTLTRDEFDALWNLTVELLQIGKRYNRIIVANPADVGKPRSRMNHSERLLVYKKEFCARCESPVESWKLAARTVFACPTCQSE